MEAIHKELVQEVEKYKAFQKDFQKTYNLRQKLDSQLNENNVVKEELDLLEADAGGLQTKYGPTCSVEDRVVPKKAETKIVNKT
uniref:Putative prefoldin subunit 6 n=1 Tax=Ixodes ricinus TaxID=34613 RepID=V5HTP2_IXORI